MNGTEPSLLAGVPAPLIDEVVLQAAEQEGSEAASGLADVPDAAFRKQAIEEALREVLGIGLRVAGAPNEGI
jgi:hypothetical protein